MLFRSNEERERERDWLHRPPVGKIALPDRVQEEVQLVTEKETHRSDKSLIVVRPYRCAEVFKTNAEQDRSIASRKL